MIRRSANLVSGQALATRRAASRCRGAVDDRSAQYRSFLHDPSEVHHRITFAYVPDYTQVVRDEEHAQHSLLTALFWRLSYHDQSQRHGWVPVAVDFNLR